MRHLIAALGLFLALTATAWAECTGRDLFAELKAEDPAAANALLAEARAVPNGVGRFWRIGKPGVEPSHMFGTFHVSGAVEGVPNGVWETLESARVAVFEVTLAAESTMEARIQEDASFVLDEDARPFAERIGPGDLALVEQAFRSRGVAPKVAERLRPWMQLSVLAFPPCQIEAVQAGARMLDAVLAARAVETGVPEVGLEDALETLEALSRMPEEDVTRLIVAAGRTADIEVDLFITHLELYRSGEIALIDIFSQWMNKRLVPDLGLSKVNERMMADLLDGRNAEWMPKLLDEVGRGNAFVAVGALHLIGENGLLAALEREGYTVTRLD